MARTTLTLLTLATTSALASINNGVHLKLMPQGASITRGVDSTTGTGYRLDLRNLLEPNGNKVTYVGSVSYGQMSNNLCEAHPGYTIAQVDSVAKTDGAYDYKPNVVLLNAGTNDCNIAGGDPAGAPARYYTLLKDIHAAVPGTLVVASSLIHNLNDSVDKCIQTLNKGIKQAVDNATAAGLNMGYVDMYNVVPKSEINTTDKTHPSDKGYELMAEAWFKELKAVGKQISKPASGGKAVPSTTPSGP